jgi:hypothetical protein
VREGSKGGKDRVSFRGGDGESGYSYSTPSPRSFRASGEGDWKKRKKKSNVFLVVFWISVGAINMEKTRTCTDDVRRLRGAFGGVETGKGLSCEIHAVRRSVVHIASVVSSERVLACQIRRTKARVVVPDAPVQHRHAFHLFAVRDLQQVVQIRVVRVRVRAFVITGHVLRIHGRTELVQPRSGVQGLQGVCRFHGLGGRHAGASANRSGCAIRRVTRDVQKPVMRRFRERPHTELSSWIVGDTGSGRV